MELTAQLLKEMAEILGVDEVRVATEEDTGPFMVLRTRCFDNGSQYTGITRKVSTNAILRYKTLEEAQESTMGELIEFNQVEARLLFKPIFTIVTY